MANDAFVFEQRGSTWTCAWKDRSAWPFLLVARHVYHGTGRLLSTLTLARTDKAESIVVLTEHVDLLTGTRRRGFAKESAHRLKSSSESSEEALETSFASMLDALLERLLESQNEIEMVSAADIILPKDLTPPYALWPMIPSSRPGMLVGPSGMGKSTLARLIGLSVVTGKTFLERLIPRVEGPVLYVGQEEDREQWGAALAMICRGHQVEIPKDYWYIKLTGASLIESAEMLAEKAASRKAALIIIDSAQATWGSETDAVRGYASQWYNQVGSLGVPALVIEHPNLADTRKPDMNGGFAAGTSVKRDRVGHAWFMKSIEMPRRDGQPLRYHVSLTDTKRNYVAKQPDITYETVIHGYEWMKFVEAETLTADTVVNSSRLDDAMAAIIRGADDEHLELGWTVTELVSRLKLQDDKRPRQSLAGDYWRPAGWDKGIEYRFERVPGTGSNHITNPARFRLLTRSAMVQMSIPPGDSGWDS